jgi:hypothetical protein
MRPSTATSAAHEVREEVEIRRVKLGAEGREEVCATIPLTR